MWKTYRGTRSHTHRKTSGQMVLAEHRAPMGFKGLCVLFPFQIPSVSTHTHTYQPHTKQGRLSHTHTHTHRLASWRRERVFFLLFNLICLMWNPTRSIQLAVIYQRTREKKNHIWCVCVCVCDSTYLRGLERQLSSASQFSNLSRFPRGLLSFYTTGD